MLTAAKSVNIALCRVVKVALFNDTLVLLVEAVRMLKFLSNLTGTKEQLKNPDYKDSLDFASNCGAQITVESFASCDKLRLATSNAGNILRLPRNTGIVTSSINNIHHGAVITHMELSAEPVNTIYGLCVASSVIVHKVAPAAVLVDVVEAGTQDFGEVSICSLSGLHEATDVSIQQLSHIRLHLSQRGQADTGQRGKLKELHGRLVNPEIV